MLNGILRLDADVIKVSEEGRRRQKAEGERRKRQKALLREWECLIPQAANDDIT